MGVEKTSGLGFQLYADAADTVHREGRPFTVIGHLHSPEEFLVTEDPADGSVRVFSADLAAAWPLNTSRSALELCLEAIERYLQSAPQNAAPQVFTAEEMRERLDRLARGEVAPRTPPKQAVPHRERVKQLRRELKAADRTALTRASWWSGTLEEAKNDLI